MVAPSTFGVPAGLVHRTILPHLGRSHVGVGRKRRAAETHDLPRPRPLDATPHRGRRLAASLVAQLLERDAGDFHVDVDTCTCVRCKCAIEEGPGEASAQRGSG
jgi:hypothetical protein